MAKAPQKEEKKKANLGSILDVPADSLKRPPALPAGPYLAVVKGLPQEDIANNEKQTPYIEFTYRLIEALDGVDEDELKEVGGLKDKEFRHVFYLTEKAGYRLMEFLRDDLKIEHEDRLTREMVEDSPGKEFILYITKKPTKDGKGFYNEIQKTAPVEE